jgi:hypothetical protein
MVLRREGGRTMKRKEKSYVPSSPYDPSGKAMHARALLAALKPLGWRVMMKETGQLVLERLRDDAARLPYETRYWVRHEFSREVRRILAPHRSLLDATGRRQAPAAVDLPV